MLSHSGRSSLPTPGRPDRRGPDRLFAQSRVLAFLLNSPTFIERSIFEQRHCMRGSDHHSISEFHRSVLSHLFHQARLDSLVRNHRVKQGQNTAVRQPYKNLVHVGMPLHSPDPQFAHIQGYLFLVAFEVKKFKGSWGVLGSIIIHAGEDITLIRESAIEQP